MKKYVSFVASICSIIVCASNTKVSAKEDEKTHNNLQKKSDATVVTCSYNMKLVEGYYCPEVKHTCLKWLDVPSHYRCSSDVDNPTCWGKKNEPLISPRRCAKFAEPKCASKTKKPLRFCMDKYEWPNEGDARPSIGISWKNAQAACKSLGKRLCTVEEWNFACEGEDMLPYPYGNERDASKCNIDVNRGATDPPRSEWPRLYSAKTGNELDKCVSPFGIVNMTGNVDEWVDDPTKSLEKAPYRSSLSGGWWGPIRARCRPKTVAHGPEFEFYQIGFRCCSPALSYRH